MQNYRVHEGGRQLSVAVGKVTLLQLASRNQTARRDQDGTILCRADDNEETLTLDLVASTVRPGCKIHGFVQ